MKKFFWSALTLILLVIILVIYFRNVGIFGMISMDMVIPGLGSLGVNQLFLYSIFLSFLLGISSVFAVQSFTSKDDVDDEFNL